MAVEVWTSRISSKDPDRLDITRESAGLDGIAFAPSWDILRPAHDARRENELHLDAGDQLGASLVEGDAWQVYVPAFMAEMRASYRANRAAWDAMLARQRVVLVCDCTDPDRCHRTLLARDILTKLGATYRGELSKEDSFDPFHAPDAEELRSEISEVRKKANAEDSRRKSFSSDRTPFVDAFVESGEIKNFPFIQDDSDAENSVVYNDPLDLKSEMERAVSLSLLLSKNKSSSNSVSIAHWLMTSYDETFRSDLPEMPMSSISVDRILGHIQALRADLEPRVAISMARRLATLLLCAANGRRAAGVSNADSSRNKKRRREQPPQDEPYDYSEPDRAASKQVKKNAESASIKKEALRDHVKKNGPFPILHIDYTGERIVVYTEKSEDAFGVPSKSERRVDTAKKERKVLEYCRVTESMKFHGGESMDTGLIVERLNPNDYEKGELGRYSSNGQQLVVVRWLDRPRMVPGSKLERASEAEFNSQRTGLNQ